MTETVKSGESQRFWLISSPRTASTMLIRILNLDAQGVRPSNFGGYFFMPAFMKRNVLQSKPLSKWSDEETKNTMETLQQCFDKLQDYIEKAEEEKQLIFVKEHAMLLNHPFIESEWLHGEGTATKELPPPLVPRGAAETTRSALNKTCLPDEFLKLWKPTFLIRHPAMIFTSMFRMLRSEGFDPQKDRPATELARHWQRALYDFYENLHGKDSNWPIVLDADDIMRHPELVAKYARIVGLDPEKLVFSWAKTPQEEVDKMPALRRAAHGYLNKSDKVDLSKVAGNIDIDQEAVKWREDFGDADGAEIERLVRAHMPDYEYMRSKRLTID